MSDSDIVEIKKEVAVLQERIKNERILVSIVGLVILTFLGYINLFSIPTEAEKQVTEKMDPAVDDAMASWLKNNSAFEYIKKLEEMKAEAENLINTISQRDQEAIRLINLIRIKLVDTPWPEGAYGVLASGECPQGFARKSAFLHAIKFQQNSDTYIGQSSLGSSRINIHNNGQSGALANLDLVVCVK